MFFRSWGVGKDAASAFQNAIENEKNIHSDLSFQLSNMTCKRIPLPRKMNSGDLELKLILTVHAEECEKTRRLTTSEEKNRTWFYEHYKDKAKYFLRWFKNNIKDKKCLAIVEKREIDKIYYRFVGHTHYELNDYDDSDVEYETDFEEDLSPGLSIMSIEDNNTDQELSDSLSCLSV
jgi:hypothetical protein